ncbi:MAG: hypothetical protein K2Y37_27115 [Pirellulales bacterium]|nr:hypothetical protein [Pirellulales bacterium]
MPKLFIVANALGLIALCFHANAAGAQVATIVRQSTYTARSGIPVVVSIEYFNGGTAPIAVYPLHDYYMDFVSWEWRGPGDEKHSIRLIDLHYSAIPEPLALLPVDVPPNDRAIWYFTIPTPAKFGDKTRWKLMATIKGGTYSPTGKDVIKETTYVCRDLNIHRLADRLGPTLPQAALLEWPRYDVLQQLDRKGLLPEVEYCCNEGDRQAEMILFSQSLLTGKARAIAS